VPLDYAKPNGKKIKLAVDRIGNTGTKAERQGALVYNPGGPGGSGMRFPLRVTTKNPLWVNTSKAYDFVGFDPRGVGHSAPISCIDPQEFVKAPKADPVPDSEADKRAQRKLAREYADGCAERSGDMLPQMTTPNTARDLDVIRAALGEKKLNYLGVSYGTYLGAVYGTLFPSHVRRMIVGQCRQPVAREDLVRGQPRPGRRLRDAAGRTGRTGSPRTTRPSTSAPPGPRSRRKWLKLRATAKKSPIGGVVGPAELLGFFQSAPYYDSSWVPVATVFSKYVAGDTQALVDAAAPRPVGHRGQHLLGERQRRLHGRRVHRRQVAHQLEEVGPRQHQAAQELPVHDLGQRLDEPAVRDLARQAADPGQREVRQGSAARPDRAVHA
jgi:pimeloyl-ACP methyl ester carboxylesterase